MNVLTFWVSRVFGAEYSDPATLSLLPSVPHVAGYSVRKEEKLVALTLVYHHLRRNPVVNNHFTIMAHRREDTR